MLELLSHAVYSRDRIVQYTCDLSGRVLAFVAADYLAALEGVELFAGFWWWWTWLSWEVRCVSVVKGRNAPRGESPNDSSR
jgi:hypothetical protein